MLVKEGQATLIAIRAMGLPACSIIDVQVSFQIHCLTCRQQWDRGFQTPFRCPKYPEILHA